MKNLLKKCKSYGFWTTLSGAIVIFVQAIARACGKEIESEVVSNIVMGFAGILVVVGVVSMGDKNDDKNKGDEK